MVAHTECATVSSRCRTPGTRAARAGGDWVLDDAQVRRELSSTTSSTAAAPLLLIARLGRVAGRRCLGGGGDQSCQRQHELALEALERLRTRALASHLRDTRAGLQIDITHARDETDDCEYDLDELIAASIFSSHSRTWSRSGTYGDVGVCAPLLAAAVSTRKGRVTASRSRASRLSVKNEYGSADRFTRAADLMHSFLLALRLPARAPSGAAKVNPLENES
jgi:hypothetical protein